MRQPWVFVIAYTLCASVASGQPLSSEAPQPPYLRKIALLIGIGRYEPGQNKGRFLNIPGVEKDLRTLSSALSDIGFETLVYSDLAKPHGTAPFRSLLKPSESRDQSVNISHIGRILGNVLDDLEASAERALLLVYFSGHGGIIGKAERVMALPDSTNADPDSFYRKKKLLYYLTDRAPFVDKYLIVDACAVKFGGKGEPMPVQLDDELPTYLFSSKSGTPSFIDPEIGQSVFTYYLVETISRAKDLNLLSDGAALDSEAIRARLIDVVPKHRRILRKDDMTAARGGVQEPIGSTQRIILAEPKSAPSLSNETLNARIRMLVEEYGSK